MDNSNLLKGGAIVIVLIAALTVFDLYGGTPPSQMTGAVILTGEDEGTATSGYGAVTDVLNAGESKTYAIAGKDYEVIVVSIDSRVVFSVNGEATRVLVNDLKVGLSIGEAYRLADGIVTIKVLRLSDEDGVRKVEFTLFSAGDAATVILPNCVVKTSKAVTCTMEEGKNNLIPVGSNEYVVSLDFVGSTAASFTIEGETTPSLREGDAWELRDGANLNVLKLTVDSQAGGKRAVEFMLTAAGQKEAINREAAVEDSLNDGESKLYTIGGRDYELTVRRIYKNDDGGKEAFILVATKDASFGMGMTEGQAGVFGRVSLKVDDILYQEFAGGVKVVTFRIYEGDVTGITNTKTVTLEPGWNIIGINTLKNMASTTCSRNSISDDVFAYFPQESKYGRYKLSSNFKSLGAIHGLLYEENEKEEAERLKNTYGFPNAVWLYYDETAPCNFVSGLKPQAAALSLSAGWNMLNVQPDWEKENFGNLLGTCNTIGGSNLVGYFYDAKSGWISINKGTTVDTASIGKGFWAYVDEACSFGLV